MDRIFLTGTTAARVALVVVLLAAAVFRPSSALSATVTITYSYDQNGQLTTVDYGSNGRIVYVYDAAGNMIHTEVVTTLTRSISVNFTSGGVGSFFTIRGAGFTANGQVLILANDIPLSPPVQCDGSGNFVLVLSSAGASAGIYNISAVQIAGSAIQEVAAATSTATFLITSGAPVRERETGTSTVPSIALPANSALPPLSLYLPTLLRD